MSSYETIPSYYSQAAADFSTAYSENNRQDLERRGAFKRAEQLVANKSLERYVALIPVAAHQESNNIYNSMKQYASQRNCDKFSVVLNMNWPDGADTRSISNSFAELNRAKNDFPELDVREIDKQYDANTNIGEIRKDLWDTALIAGIIGETIDEEHEMYGLNHDIDIVHMPTNTIQNIQNFYKNDAYRTNKQLGVLGISEQFAHQQEPTGIPMKHSADLAYPNSSRASLWYDTDVYIGGNSFEAGLNIPMSRYAQAGGFDTSNNTYETCTILNKTKTRHIHRINTPISVTSSRRLIDSFNSGRYYTDLWPSGEFSTSENYRNENYTHQKDVSDDRLYEMVEKKASYQLSHSMIMGAKNSILSDVKTGERADLRRHMSLFSLEKDKNKESETYLREEIDARIKRLSRVARFVLNDYIRHPNANDIVDTYLAEARSMTGLLL